MREHRLRLALVAGVLLAIAVAGGVPALTAAGPVAPSVAAPARTEVLVMRLTFHDRAERDRLATQWGAEEVPTVNGYLTVWGDQATYKAMLAQGLRVSIDEATTRQANNPHLFGAHGPDTFYGGYKTVEEMQTFLDQEVAAHPTLAQNVNIGPSWCKANPGACTLPTPYDGYNLQVLHITNQAIPGPKPVYWYDAGIHAREIATPEVAARYIQWLLDGYNTNPDAHWLVDWHDIWVLPMFNPDGHHIVEAGGGGDNPYWQRKNANDTNGCRYWPPDPGTQFGTDNNRNFPFLWNCCGGSSANACDQTYHGPSAGSEPETQAVIAKIRALIPDQRGPGNNDAAPITTTGILQNMHSPSQLDLYPWGWTGSAAPNGQDLANIAQHMSAPNAGGNGYLACQAPNCLYTVDGDAFDWGYGELGAPHFTTEIEGDFMPPYSQVEQIWQNNAGALIYQAKIARQPYLTTRGPDANLLATQPMTVTQGSPAQLTATINYAWTGNSYIQNVAAAEFYLDIPPWAGGAPNAMTGNFTSQTVAAQATLDSAALTVGRHIIFVRGRGVNDYSGFHSWGPVSAAFLDVTAPNGTPTATATVVPSAPAPSATAPPAPSMTATTAPAPSATASSVPCTATFSDVHTTDYFYIPVQYLACHGVVSGYADGTFRPYNNTTRAQMVKIVVLGLGVPIVTPPGGGNTFADVQTHSAFFAVIESAAAAHIVSGYTCGSLPSEPCDAQGRPYFRPNANVTRGQLAKIVVVAQGWAQRTPPTPTFADVPASNPFFGYVEAALCHGIVSGYADGTYRPNANALRGQIAKIVYGAITGGAPCAPAGK